MDLGSEEINKEECTHQFDHQNRWIESLPRDIIIDILSRLPIKSIMHIRLVNRALNLLSYDPNLASLHFTRTSGYNPHLIFHSDYPIKNELRIFELSDQLDHENLRKISIPFYNLMPEFEIIASCNGLLCLSDSLYSERLIIYNPFTGKYKELPKCREYDDQEVIIGFGFHPMTNEHKVVKLIIYWTQYDGDDFLGHRRPTREGAGSDVQIFTLEKNNNWRTIGRVPYKLSLRDSPPVLFSGRLHFLTQPKIHRENGGFYGYRDIISLDLQHESFEEVPRPECGGLNHLNYHLVVLQGCFSAMVFIYQERVEIWVMKEYNVKESWSKQFVLPECSKQFLRPEMQSRPYKIWKNVMNKRSPRVVCLLKNGDILIEYKSGALVSHNPESGAFKKLMIRGMPDLVHTVIHIASLKWIETMNSQISNR